MKITDTLGKLVELSQAYPTDVCSWVVPEDMKGSESYWTAEDTDVLDVRITTKTVDFPKVELGVLGGNGELKLYFLAWTNTQHGFQMVLDVLSEFGQ